MKTGYPGKGKLVWVFRNRDLFVVLLLALVFRSMEGIVLGLLALYLLTLVHELGHAFLAGLCGGKIEQIEIGLLRGHCAYRCGGDIRPRLIAWGGVLAEGLLILGVYLWYDWLAQQPDAREQVWLMPFFMTTIVVGLVSIAINLLPIRDLDGVRAWSLFPALASQLVPGRRFRRRLPASRVPEYPRNISFEYLELSVRGSKSCIRTVRVKTE